METEDPNPFQPPESPGKMQKTPSVRPNLFDWFFAILLGLLAAAFAFPVTCLGTIMLSSFAERLVSRLVFDNAGLQETVLSLGLLSVWVGLTLYCAVWATRSYLNAVRKKSAARQNPNPDEPKA